MSSWISNCRVYSIILFTICSCSIGNAQWHTVLLGSSEFREDHFARNDVDDIVKTRLPLA